MKYKDNFFLNNNNETQYPIPNHPILPQSPNPNSNKYQFIFNLIFYHNIFIFIKHKHI